MKKATFVIVILSLTLAGSVLFLWTSSRASDQGAAAVEGEEFPSLPASQAEEVRAPISQSAKADQSASASSIGGATIRQVVVSTKDLSQRGASNLALSVEEARWLAQNGYPSAWEIQNLDVLDWKAVRAAAFRGDEVAQNLLAEQLLAAGDVEAAAAMFGNPRGIDSIYAMVRSSELEATLGRFPRAEDNYRQFMLHAEYARLMGDHQIDRVIQRVLPSTVDRRALQQEALRSLPDFARSRFDLAARTNLPAPRPAIRPNQEQWQQIQPGVSQVVTIHLPSPYARPSGR